jgi:anion-transporting  ArsA/GET3 family ATPase
LAEPLPDRETARLVQGLRTLGIPLTGMIVNRVLLRKNNNCARCRTHAAWQRASLANLRKGVSQNIAVYCIEEQADAISGRAALQEFSKQLWRLS